MHFTCTHPYALKLQQELGFGKVRCLSNKLYKKKKEESGQKTHVGDWAKDGDSYFALTWNDKSLVGMRNESFSFKQEGYHSRLLSLAVTAEVDKCEANLKYLYRKNTRSSDQRPVAVVIKS